ncbi:anti-sigma factor antagonist [Microbispora catharanthi]|uniref:Anti-sigma factor antagonist n=1 Tax=Microbispora catharanthi TaxID=1712871 RepID=A0A5N6BIM2_9ACTN|nr:anti-sigma factor antagonist [Microbispora catharanthi]
MPVTGPRSTLKVASAVDGAAVVVRVEGDLDAGTVHLLHDELHRVWESSGTSVLVIDVAELEFCDSRGLSELISALQRGQALNVRLMLSGVQGVLRRVLTITGLRNVFEQHPTVAEALGHAADAGPRLPRSGGEPDSDSDPGGLYEIAGDR